MKSYALLREFRQQEQQGRSSSNKKPAMNPTNSNENS
jgi:hypothetical protein